MMKTILLFLMMTSTAMADCDFSTGITPLSGGGYKYSQDCHIAVGKLVQDNKTKDLQISDLTQAITLKDLALQKSDERTKLWMDTSFTLQDRITKIDQLRSSNETLYFGLGVLTTVLAGWSIRQISR